jgi:hypothetical protein
MSHRCGSCRDSGHDEYMPIQVPLRLAIGRSPFQIKSRADYAARPLANREKGGQTPASELLL